MKQRVFMFALLVLTGTAEQAMAFGQFTDGVSGFVIWVFLAYCAIIVVAQLFSALLALSRLLNDLTSEKNKSKKVFLR